MQPSCAYLKFVEFYAPVHLCLAETDTAANSLQSVVPHGSEQSSHPLLSNLKSGKGVTHSYEDRGSLRQLIQSGRGKIVKLEYNATAADSGTTTAIVNILNSHKASSARRRPSWAGATAKFRSAIACSAPPEFSQPDQRDLPRPASICKNILLRARPPMHPYKSGHPVPLEGRWPSSRTLGRVAVDAAALGACVIAGRALSP